MKIQEDSEEHSSQTLSKMVNNPLHTSDNFRNNRKYNKITHDIRLQFLDKIFFENKSIKKAAQELNINYSSAKTILNLHRKKQRFLQQQPPICSITEVSSEVDASKTCGFQTQTAFKKQKLELIITLGGRLMNSNKIEPTIAVSPPNFPMISPSISQGESTSSIQKQIQQQQQQQQQQQLLIQLFQEQQRIQLQESQQAQLLQQEQQQQQLLQTIQSSQQDQSSQLTISPQILALLFKQSQLQQHQQQQQQQQDQLLLAQFLQHQQQQEMQQPTFLDQQPIFGIL